MALDKRQSEKDNLNPAKSDYADKFGFDPYRGTDNNLTRQQKDKKNLDSLKESEKSPDTEWANNVNEEHKTERSGAKTANRKLGLKKRIPIAIALTIMLGGGAGLIFLIAPSLLLDQFSNLLVGGQNQQLSSMTVRSRNILKTKMLSSSKLCSTLSIGCKYTSMSTNQIKALEDAGVKVNIDGDSINLNGKTRNKISSLEFDGKTIGANDLAGELVENTKLRSAVNEAFDIKYAGFSDSIWKKVSAYRGISKAPKDLDGDTDAEKLDSLQDEVNGKKADVDDIDGVKTDDLDDDASTAARETADELDDIADEVAESGQKASRETVEEIAQESSQELAEITAKFSSKSVINAFKITGVADALCLLYNTIRAIGFAAKISRSTQLINLSTSFLTTVDQKKAGDGDAGTIEFWGNLLTTKDSSGQTVTDSFGYNYLANDDLSGMSESSMQYMTGAGLAGTMTGITSSFNQLGLGTPNTVCKVLNNIWFSLGSLVAGIAVMAFSGGTYTGVTISGQAVVSGLTQAGIAVGATFLPNLLADLVAGVLVDESTVGGEMGDALTSGTGALMSDLAKSGGNAPLTPEQAVAYNQLSTEIAEQYAAEDRLASSQWDVTNSNTFAGKLLASITPYLVKLSSLSGAISSLTSMTSRTIASLSPSNAYADNREEAYTMCEDYDYMDPNGDGNTSDRIATDPFCNVMYGIPPEYLDDDPLIVEETLASNGQIDPQTGEIVGPDYQEFLTNCIDRTNFFGYTGDDNQGSDGTECMIDDDNKDYYLYYIDQRVLAVMEGEDG